jgi:glycosyltransferase involved in cell wall biosynthesis
MKVIEPSDGNSAADRRPRVAYISYDAVGGPLGQSQVLPYLTRLAGEYQITLISFETSDEGRSDIEAAVSQHGIQWFPLSYHRWPPVLSTVLDVVAGSHALRKVASDGPPAIVHVRSDVPALMATLARGATRAKLLFDIRGFWADERVDGGLWRRNGVLYRIARRGERRFFQDADAIVTLTEASVPVIRSWTARPVPVEVIPTCVDLERFTLRARRPDGPHAVWSGSIGTWYRFDLAAKIAAALSWPLSVMTRQPKVARAVLGSFPADVRSLTPAEVPSQLFAGDVGLCLIRSSFSKIASAPTRFAEFLAAGMPVVVTPRVGDLEAIVDDRKVGVVLRGEGDRGIAAAATAIRRLAEDPDISERCRSVACELFGVDDGGSRYRSIYRYLTDA